MYTYQTKYHCNRSKYKSQQENGSHFENFCRHHSTSSTMTKYLCSIFQELWSYFSKHEYFLNNQLMQDTIKNNYANFRYSLSHSFRGEDFQSCSREKRQKNCFRGQYNYMGRPVILKIWPDPLPDGKPLIRQLLSC